MEIRWVPGESDAPSAAQEVELLLRRYSTHRVRTQDLVSGQMAEKAMGWAVYPSLKRDNKRMFPVELEVIADESVAPRDDSTEVKKLWFKSRKRLRWTASGRRVPRHFGYFGLKTEEPARGVDIRRECLPLGNERARITITVRADTPLLLRVWGLKGGVNVEPESIRPEEHRLSDNGVLFFDYGKKGTGEIGNTSEYTFVVSPLPDGRLYYPMTNVLRYVPVHSEGCPATALREIQGSIWGFTFKLRSRECFRVATLEKWVNELYELDALTVGN